MTDLEALAKPFNDSVVQTKPGQDGGSYVEHGVVVQKLLATVGPFDMEHVQPVHGIVPAKVNKQGEIVRDADPNGVVGCLLTCRFRIDGQDVVVTEAGDVEHPENKATNGARMKDAVSDAVKRCAMRIGVGLHLWGNSGYFLPDALTESMADPNPPQTADPNPQPEGEATHKDEELDALLDQCAEAGYELNRSEVHAYAETSAKHREAALQSLRDRLPQQMAEGGEPAPFDPVTDEQMRDLLHVLSQLPEPENEQTRVLQECDCGELGELSAQQASQHVDRLTKRLAEKQAAEAAKESASA